MVENDQIIIIITTTVIFAGIRVFHETQELNEECSERWGLDPGQDWRGSECLFLLCSPDSLALPQPPQSPPWEPGIPTGVLQSSGRSQGGCGQEERMLTEGGVGSARSQTLQPLPHGAWRKGRGGKGEQSRWAPVSTQ